jgi:PPOX class probable F420-dependent enzyme
MPHALSEQTARFFRAPTYPVVTTVLPDGSPQSSIVWATVVDGRILFSTIRGRRKTRNLERDPRVSVIAHDPADPYSYVEVRGTVELEDDPTASLIDELSRAYDGVPWTRRPGEERVIARVTPTRVVEHVTAQSRGTNAGARPEGPVRQLRLVVHAEDYEETVRFYRDVLGMPQQEAYSGGDGAEVVILGAGRATLEIANTPQVEMIDDVEVGHRVAPKFRLALEVDDSAAVTKVATVGGAQVIAAPTRTPWDSLNARLSTPGGIQLTLFQELGGDA